MTSSMISVHIVIFIQLIILCGLSSCRGRCVAQTPLRVASACSVILLHPHSSCIFHNHDNSITAKPTDFWKEAFKLYFLLVLWAQQADHHLVPLYSGEGSRLYIRYLQNSNSITGKRKIWILFFLFWGKQSL